MKMSRFFIADSPHDKTIWRKDSDGSWYVSYPEANPNAIDFTKQWSSRKCGPWDFDNIHEIDEYVKHLGEGFLFKEISEEELFLSYL